MIGSIIIINYHSTELILNLLREFEDGILNAEILIFDNTENSSDEAFNQPYKNIELRYFKGRRNIGFGSAVNVLVKFSKSNKLLFVNPDVKISCNQVRNGFSLLNNAEYGSFYSDDRIKSDNAVLFPGVFRMVLEFIPKRYRINMSNYSPSTHYIDGSMFFIRRPAFERCQGFNDLFLYGEDVFLNEKLRDCNAQPFYELGGYEHKRSTSGGKITGRKLRIKAKRIIYSKLLFLSSRNIFYKTLYFNGEITSQILKSIFKIFIFYDIRFHIWTVFYLIFYIRFIFDSNFKDEYNHIKVSEDDYFELK